MWWLRQIVVILSCSALALACKAKGGDCSERPRLEKLSLPAAFHVYRSEEYLGVVTIPPTGNPTFRAVSTNESLVSALREDVDKAAAADAVTMKYETGGDGVHNLCGMSVKKGTPEYADAFRQHLWGRYYEVKDRAP